MVLITYRLITDQYHRNLICDVHVNLFFPLAYCIKCLFIGVVKDYNNTICISIICSSHGSKLFLSSCVEYLKYTVYTINRYFFYNKFSTNCNICLFTKCSILSKSQYIMLLSKEKVDSEGILSLDIRQISLTTKSSQQLKKD